MSTEETKLMAKGRHAASRERQDAEYVSNFDRVAEAAKRLEAATESKRTVRAKGEEAATGGTLTAFRRASARRTVARFKYYRRRG